MYYVLSDIHGQYKKFLAMLNKIRFSDEDQMFILGDVIDRGPQPLDTLMHILSEPNMQLLIGNHEHMMMEAYASPDNIAIWVQNGAEKTIKQLDKLSAESQLSLMRALERCPLVIPNLRVGKRSFYLTHAAPAPFYLDSPLYYYQAIDDMREAIVWDRDISALGLSPAEKMSKDAFKRYRGRRMIIGHTVTKRSRYGVTTSTGAPRISRNYKGHVINIDCGCANNLVLGCLRLDDLAEFYT